MMPVPAALATALRDARHVVVFTGAGVSAESGVPTFRDALIGLWARFDPAALATPEAFDTDPDTVWGWYEWRRMQALRAQPNAAHRAIAAMAGHAKRFTLVTQNVDDLHERAGSEPVIHLHGSLHAPRCARCECAYTMARGIPDEPDGGRRLPPPRCKSCGGPVRPGVVWFGEYLPEAALAAAQSAARDCDLFITVGTSSMVYPAAQLPHIALAQGARVVQVNPDETRLDAEATWTLRGEAGLVLPILVDSAWG